MHESLLGFGVAGELRGKKLQCDGAVELEVLGFVDDAHASAADVLEDPVVRNRLTDEIRHDNSFRGGSKKGIRTLASRYRGCPFKDLMASK
jgi:hypothetical protein